MTLSPLKPVQTQSAVKTTGGQSVGRRTMTAGFIAHWELGYPLDNERGAAIHRQVLASKSFAPALIVEEFGPDHAREPRMPRMRADNGKNEKTGSQEKAVASSSPSSPWLPAPGSWLYKVA